MDLKEKKRMIADLVEMLESTESSIRLEAARLVLYLLQGAYGDFKTTDADEKYVYVDGILYPPDNGTGNYEHQCLVRGGVNAYFCYQQHLYPVSILSLFNFK